jgi:hypothetical protein
MPPIITQLRQSLTIALWFMFLTFPILVIRVNTIEQIIDWRWMNMIYVGTGSFILSFAWRYLLTRRERGDTSVRNDSGRGAERNRLQQLREDARIARPVMAFASLAAVVFPFLPFASTYQINIITNALLYVMLGLGLNIVVGLTGLLHLGYVAFYAVGAYTFGLLHYHFGIGFWTACPLGRSRPRSSASSWDSPCFASGGLSGHRHPGVRRDHPSRARKLERLLLRARRYRQHPRPGLFVSTWIYTKRPSIFIT